MTVNATDKTPLRLHIARLNAYGVGVALKDGLKHLVPGVLEGETVEVSAVSHKKDSVHCELIRVITASLKRVKPPCPYYGVCGGCDLQHASYQEQLRLKSTWISEILASWPEVKIDEIVPAPSPYGYRNRVTFHHDGRNFGFHRGHSNEIVRVERCLIASEAVNDKISALTEEIYRGPDSFEVREDAGSAFIQVNPSQNENLISAVVNLAKLKKSHRVLELYAGTGNFTFALARGCREVIAIEGNTNAVNEANQRRKTSGVKNMHFTCESAYDAVFRLTQDLKTFDVIVCDPSRDGLRDVAGSMSRLGATRIIYVACEPRAFLRDAERISRGRAYHLSRIRPIDMFPQTRHVELVAVFEKIEKD